MFYILTASSDTYITNKILNNKFRATDANMGRAGTLDLFRLYDESIFTSNGNIVTSSVEELYRLFVKFDYSKSKVFSPSRCTVLYSGNISSN